MTIYLLSEHHVHTKQNYKQAFTCERTATEFCRECLNIARAARCLEDILMFSPDPTVQTESVKRNLTSRRIYYTLHINELVTDAFMELALQPRKPKPFKELI